jgi:putative transposase
MEESLSHTKWECKYHIVFIPKCCKKALCNMLRKELGGVFRGLAHQKECQVAEWTMMYHVHAFKCAAQILGFAGCRLHKRKECIYLARNFGDRKKNFTGYKFWPRGYYVSTVGRDEETIRTYITADERMDAQIALGLQG